MKVKHRAISARTIIAISLAIAVVAVIVVGIVLLDSPAQARLRRLDERRIVDLREISYAIDVFWTREGVLPNSLEDLGSNGRFLRELVDPETGDPYEYRQGSEDHYELCAEFSTTFGFEGREILHDYPWFHDEGWQCLQLVARNLDDGR